MLNKKIKILTLIIGVGIGIFGSATSAYAIEKEQAEKMELEKERVVDPLKSKGNFFKVKTNSVYHFLTKKAKENGYKVIWNIGTINDYYDDNRLVLSTNETLIDSVGMAVNNLNYIVGGTAANLNLVFGFICPLNKEITVTYSKTAKMVIDKDGYMCTMITPIKFLDDSSISEQRMNIAKESTTYQNNNTPNVSENNYNDTKLVGQKVELKRDLSAIKERNKKARDDYLKAKAQAQSTEQAEPYIMDNE